MAVRTDSLRLPQEAMRRGWLPSHAKPKRTETIDEAVRFPAGESQDDQITTVLYELGEYRVGVAKPGKEVFREDRRNVNDMLPVVLDRVGNPVTYVPGFNEIFRQLWQLHAANRDALVLLGCLAFRNAYLLDHQRVDGALRYCPPADVLEAIEATAPVITSGRLVLPVRTYLFVLEALALNEDVKYWTLRGGIEGDVGRVNNLRTYVHVIAACLDLAHPFDVGTGLMRAGVAPYGITQSVEDFEPLQPRRLT